MNDKKVINWQLVDKYYPYLIQKVQRIDYYLSVEEYEVAFKELSQIFIHINAEIKNHDKTKEKYQPLLSLIRDLKQKIREFNLFQIQNNKPPLSKIKKLSKIKAEIADMVEEQLYMKIMEVISDLNMFFPKVKKEPDLSIKQI